MSRETATHGPVTLTVHHPSRIQAALLLMRLLAAIRQGEIRRGQVA